MERITHEEEIAEHKSITLTNKAVIQEEETWFGNLDYMEIPLEKIESISRRHVCNNSLLIIGIVILFLGLFALDPLSSVFNSRYLLLAPFVIGFIFLFIFVLTGKKEIIIRAGTVEMVEDAKGAGKFVNRLRHQIYR